MGVQTAAPANIEYHHYNIDPAGPVPPAGGRGNTDNCVAMSLISTDSSTITNSSYKPAKLNMSLCTSRGTQKNS